MYMYRLKLNTAELSIISALKRDRINEFLSRKIKFVLLFQGILNYTSDDFCMKMMIVGRVGHKSVNNLQVAVFLVIEWLFIRNLLLIHITFH
jgi:hypothetical protein